MHPEYTPAQITRFWSHVDCSGDCWLWRRARNRQGYGKFSVNRGQWHSAHRVAWTVTYGPIPEGLYICHRCDNPPCCRPDHLFLGTAADNTHDMVVKGRARHSDVLMLHPDRNPAVLYPERLRRGPSHHSAKLTWVQVREMRRRHAAGVSFRQLAREYGTVHANVRRIIAGVKWPLSQDPDRLLRDQQRDRE